MAARCVFFEGTICWVSFEGRPRDQRQAAGLGGGLLCRERERERERERARERPIFRFGQPATSSFGPLSVEFLQVEGCGTVPLAMVLLTCFLSARHPLLKWVYLKIEDPLLDGFKWKPKGEHPKVGPQILRSTQQAGPVSFFCSDPRYGRCTEKRRSGSEKVLSREAPKDPYLPTANRLFHQLVSFLGNHFQGPKRLTLYF